ENVATKRNNVGAAGQLSWFRVPVVGKSYKAQVDGIQHQLNRHKNGDDVALEQKAEHAERKQDCAQDQIPGKRDHQPSFLPSTTAPIMAIRISTEVTSKGSRNGRNSRRAILWVSPKAIALFCGLLITTPPSCGLLCTRSHATVPASTTTAGTPAIRAKRLPRVRSSAPAFRSMMTKTNSTMMAPA